MLLHSENYNDAIKAIIKKAKTVDIAVAFWGKGADALIPAGKTVRIICNIESGATNPDVVEKLLSCKNLTVRSLDSLHAKVVLTPTLAIVGSANFSTNGLNFEGEEELKGWHEAGLVTDNKEHLEDLKAWFNSRWKESSKITPLMLTDAKNAWKNRAKSRAFDLRKGKRLIDMHPASLTGRNIFVAVYREQLSDFAKEKLQQKKSNAQDRELTKGWGCYEDWTDLGLGVGNIVIDIYIGPKNGVWINGPYEVFESSAHATSDEDEGEVEVILYYARKLKSLPGICVPAKKLFDGIGEQIARDPERLLSKDAEESRLIPLEEFISEIAAF